MALSFSRPDPSSPSAVASATFSQSRRGFDQAEVRDLLRMVAAELARLQEREKFLERELRGAQRGTTNAAVALDDEVVTRLLGEEATRILTTAREAGSQIRIRSEEGAARLLREATDEAQRLREEAEVEAARRRQDANSDAESELQMAKQQGRDMVNEARAYRERVLSELARRRELARQQIEQLIHGRDRLLQAFERARIAAVDVMAEMTPLGEPTEYVNLSPTTGPVPIMVPVAELDQAEAVTEPEAVETVDVAEIEIVEVVEIAADEEPEIVDAAPVETTPEAADDTVVLMREHHDPADVEHETDEDDDRPSAPVLSLFAGEMDRHEGGGMAHPSTEPLPDDAKPSVDSLFAKLRAARADVVVERAAVADTATDESVDATVALTLPTDELQVFKPSPVAPDVVTEVDDTPFAHRDAALTPIIVATARKLKRVLADEQNELLHTLRRKDGVRTLDALLPWAGDHTQRYAEAIETELEKAGLAGAASTHPDGGDKAHRADLNRSKALAPAVDMLRESILMPMRDRVERAVTEAGGDNGELATMVRAIYREWKTQRIDEHLDDIVRMAYGRGALAALTPGTPISWIVDPNGPACADAEDNSLGGVVNAGEPFPTDHVCAPAHAGCRCMLIVVPR